MWSRTITNTLSEFYKLHYAPQERRKYKFDMGNQIFGGAYGLNLLLNKVDTDAAIEVFSDNPVQTARDLCTAYYNESGDVHAHMDTRLPNKHMVVYAIDRPLLNVFVDGTAKHSIITKEIDGKKIRLVGPHLQLIRTLGHLYNPEMFAKREELIQTVEALMDISDGYIDYKPIQIGPLLDTIQVADVAILRERVMIYADAYSAIFISDQTPSVESSIWRARGYNCTAHDVMLPGNFFIHKIVVRSIEGGNIEQDNDEWGQSAIYSDRPGKPHHYTKKNDGNRDRPHDDRRDRPHDGNRARPHDDRRDRPHDGNRARPHDDRRARPHDGNRAQRPPARMPRITIYCVAWHELIPFEMEIMREYGWRVGIPSVIARYILIEDNTNVALFKSGILKFAAKLTSRQHIENVLHEGYPTPSPSNFYGQFQYTNVLMRQLVTSSDRYQSFFPYKKGDELNL